MKLYAICHPWAKILTDSLSAVIHLDKSTAVIAALTCLRIKVAPYIYCIHHIRILIYNAYYRYIELRTALFGDSASVTRPLYSPYDSYSGIYIGIYIAIAVAFSSFRTHTYTLLVSKPQSIASHIQQGWLQRQRKSSV